MNKSWIIAIMGDNHRVVGGNLWVLWNLSHKLKENDRVGHSIVGLSFADNHGR